MSQSQLTKSMFSTASSRRLSGGHLLPSRPVPRRCRHVHMRAEPILRKPSAPKPPKPDDEEEANPEEGEPQVVAEEKVVENSGVTLDFQRQKAKAMVAYFENQVEEEVAQKRFFGWTAENEIGNGRWAMFGILVGFLTEYATGVSIWEQVKLIITYLGIADIYDY